MAEGEQGRNFALPGSSGNGHSSKLTKISEGGDGEDYDRGKRRAVITKTGVVCISSNKEITELEDGGVSEKSSASEATCPVCYKIFFSKKAMYGHMRCHPEREWRGVNPPTPPPPPPPSSSVPPKSGDNFSPSTMKSTMVAPYTTTTTTTSRCQPTTGWLVTGRRGQNHPLSFYHTFVSSRNQVDHGRGSEEADNDNNTEEEEEEEEESGGKNSTTDGGKTRNVIDQETVSEPLLVAAREYKCSSCDKVFRTFQALGGHRASHSYRNKVESMDGGEEDSKEGGSKGMGDRFKCNICSKIFPSGQALGGHKRTHFHGSTTQATTSQGSVSEEAGKSLGGKVLDFDINDLPPMEE